MAMCTVLLRDGQPHLSPDSKGDNVGWSLWHICRVADARKAEVGLNNWDEKMFVDEHVFTHDHVFEAPETDIWTRGGTEGETYRFEIKAGDVFQCWNSR